MAAAMAALPCTTACSPYTIVLPGAETIKGGARGFEYLRLCALLGEERRESGVVGVLSPLDDASRLRSVDCVRSDNSVSPPVFPFTPFALPSRCVPFMLAD